jgi:hypothetical protein
MSSLGTLDQLLSQSHHQDASGGCILLNLTEKSASKLTPVIISRLRSLLSVNWEHQFHSATQNTTTRFLRLSKPQSFYNIIVEVTAYYLCHTLVYF